MPKYTEYSVNCSDVQSTSSNIIFRYESQLISKFVDHLYNPKNPFGISGWALEFYYLNGRTDLIGKTERGELIAFEAKLDRWKDALNQAYRNSSFAHYSFVLIPERRLRIALNAMADFNRRGVGLCSIGLSGDIKIEIMAIRKTPLQPWLTGKALSLIEAN